jgi:hypothetical protein
MGRRLRRIARPLDRIVLAAVMSVVVFILERLLARGTRKEATPTSR